MSERTEKYFGTTLSEWVSRIPAELEVDAVGLWQIIPVGRDAFELEGQEVIDFTRRCLCALLDAGARPLIGNSQKWQALKGRILDPNTTVETILAACFSADPNQQLKDNDLYELMFERQ